MHDVIVTKFDSDHGQNKVTLARGTWPELYMADIDFVPANGIVFRRNIAMNEFLRGLGVIE